MEGGENVVRGQKKTIVPMSRALLPLPLTVHAFLLTLSVLPAIVISRFDELSGLNDVMLVLIAAIYLSLRIHCSQRRYPKAPTIEVSSHEVVLPYFYHGSQVERAIPTQNLRSIEFIKGTGSLKKVDTSVVFTDDQEREFGISGFNVNLLLLREALEKHELSYTRRRNPKQFVRWAVLAVAVAAGLYWYF
jgi:hypothetical protein